MAIDLSQVQTFYEWVRKNLLMVALITGGLLFSFFVYKLIDGFAQPYGLRLANQHAELRRAVASFSALDSILGRILIRTNASRVTLYRMHNGLNDLSHMSFFFASAGNVVATPGVTADLVDIINVPAVTFTPVLPKLIAMQPALILTESLPPGAMRELQIKRGIKVAIFVPVGDLDNNLIAFLTVDWLNLTDAPEGDKRDAMVQALHEDAVRIAGYFSLAPLKDAPK